MSEKHQKSTRINGRSEIIAPSGGEAGGAGIFPRPLRARSIMPGLTVMLLAVLLIPFAEHNWRGVYSFLRWLPFDGFFAAARQFASGTAVFSICVAVWVLDRRYRNEVIVFLAAILIAATLGQALKHVARRARPEYGIRMAEKEKAWIVEYALQHPNTAIRPEPRDQWLIFSPHPPFFSDKYNAFPSGHTIAAFSLAAFLMALYPRLAWLWMLWAVGCGLARIHGRMHYPEDVLFGAGWGWVIAQMVFSWKWPARLGNRMARRFSQ